MVWAGASTFAVPYAALQHLLQALRPVAAHPGHVYLIVRQPQRVRDHHRERRRDRHRVAVGEHEGGIGEDRLQGRKLFDVLRRLEEPSRPSPKPLQDLEDLLHVPVAGPLVPGQVVVAPRGHGGQIVSNSMDEKSMASSWISSCTWSTVISCMRLK